MFKQELFIQGDAGQIETVIHTVDGEVSRVGIVCHPNPLQEGTMDNKVVTTVAKALHAMGMAAIRFNYRGVGRSAGAYGNIVGETADCMAVVQWAQQQWPQAGLCLAGFSFGAYIAAAVAAKVATEQLIAIAPAVDRMPYAALGAITCPWLIIQGEDDDVVIPASVYKWFAGLQANKKLIKFPDTGHFFHGKLLDLSNVIQAELS